MLSNHEEEKNFKKINNFLKKNNALAINGMIKEQIEKKGYWDKLWYVNRVGIHCINVEDVI
jgi:hypothetical protein